MSANGIANSQIKLKNFTLQDAGPSPVVQNGKLILYTHCLCPYAERAWLALLEKVNDTTHRQLSESLSYELKNPH